MHRRKLTEKELALVASYRGKVGRETKAVEDWQVLQIIEANNDLEDQEDRDEEILADIIYEVEALEEESGKAS